MVKKLYLLLVLFLVLGLAFPAVQPAAAQAGPIPFTILHTNDFHGQLEPSGSNPGMARTAAVVNGVRTAKGTGNVLLVDIGDEMQGSLLSNLQKGEPTIAVYNAMDYAVATFGNHEFDWGLPTLQARTTQAEYPYVSANIVSGDCSDSNWAVPSFAQPYVVQTVGSPAVRVAFIGVTSIETPIITIASATAGLCFKDPAASILHYYDEMDAASDVIVVLSHLGYPDGGYGYGIATYGDQTLAARLNAAGKPANLIIGGHSHTDLAAATLVGTTPVVQAHYNGRKVGQADFTFDPATGAVTVAWQRLTVSTTGAEDTPIKDLIATYTSDAAYQALINTPIGYTNVPIVRNYSGDSLMGYFVNDAIYNDLNSDGTTENDVEIVFNNPGGLRADISCAAYPCLLNYGMMFTILPFGNQTVVGDMTGAKIVELLQQSAAQGKGALQPSGLRYKFFNYAATTGGWGAYDICVVNKTTAACDPIDLSKTYRIATNEFLAPAGQDTFTAFKYVTNITYWGDMLNQVNNWVSTAHGTEATAYNAVLDGRITQENTIIPLTILHHNDSHGNLAKGAYVGYTQLATKIKEERAKNPTRTLLLNGGDQVQGDAMMYYFKSAPSGYAADGTALPEALQTHPMMAVMNAMDYDAMTLGNHEFNFGGQVFAGIFAQAEFPVLQANVADDGSYGLAAGNVQPYVTKEVDGINVAILGIGNHRVPNYELPSNIPGLTFSNPITKAQELSTLLRGTNDVVIALTHIGFTENPTSVEVDTNVDTNLAAEVSGIDAIIGAHSHTNPASGFGATRYLPSIAAGPGNKAVIINHAYRYNNTLGEIFIGLRAKSGGGYEVVSQSGQYISITSSIVEDPDIKAIVDPYVTQLATYNDKVVGQTTVPIDTLEAFTQETNGANLQADASVWELAQHGITDVDFHLSGAMTNKLMAAGATAAAPVTLKISDMFAGMPYENSLVVLRMNGPQLKAVLERAYRNYYYYKYVPSYGGYSHYTTCMIDTNSVGKITYNDLYPEAYDATKNYVVSLNINGQDIDFADADTYYNVSTVNYLAAGSCNFNDGGVSLWPLDQIVHDTQYYVRDAVINYITAMGIVSPMIEGRLVFDTILDTAAPLISITSPVAMTYEVTDPLTLDFSVTDVGDAGVLDVFAYLDGAAVTDGQVINLTTLPLGSHTFTVNATDKAGNAATASVTFTTADTQGPVITITVPVDGKAYLHPEKIVLAYSAVDLGSGVASMTAMLDGQPVVNGQVIDLYALSLGSHTLVVTATDNVGNVSTKTATFQVTATVKSLMWSVERFYKEGKIKNYGIKVSLLAHLYTAERFYERGDMKKTKFMLEGFIDFVEKMSGKHIKADAAKLLIADAKWVISHLVIEPPHPKPKPRAK